MAAVLFVMGTVTAFAADSKEAGATVSGNSVGRYEITAVTKDTVSSMSNSEVAAKIEAVNNNAATLASLESTGAVASSIKGKLAGKKMVTPFFNLTPVNGGVKEDGKYVVTLSVPNLTSGMKDVKILHFSEAKGVWEVIVPDKIDLASKTVTVSFDDEISVVSVIADAPAAEGTASGDATTDKNATGESPKTGSESIVLWAGAALALAAAAAVTGKKARR